MTSSQEQRVKQSPGPRLSPEGGRKIVYYRNSLKSSVGVLSVYNLNRVLEITKYQ